MQICYIKYNQSEEKYSAIKRQMIREIKKIPNAHSKIYTLYCVSMIAFNNVVSTYAATSTDLQLQEFKRNVNAKGQQILEIFTTIGFWVAIGFAAIDIIKSLKKQDLGQIIAIVVKYAITWGILNALPWIFEVVGSLFSATVPMEVK